MYVDANTRETLGPGLTSLWVLFWDFLGHVRVMVHSINFQKWSISFPLKRLKMPTRQWNYFSKNLYDCRVCPKPLLVIGKDM
jgi:hypothetical protein